MTYAPATLLAARSYLLAELDMHPGRTVDADLDPSEVGIVGDRAHDGGYHCGDDRTSDSDYSIRESSRDRAGLTNAASALDIGHFSKSGRNLRHFSKWLVAECKRGEADTRDIREVIYSPDGRTVKRWDRLGIRSSGDSSHLWHTHISYFRDSEKRDKTALFKRYIEGDDDMPSVDEFWSTDSIPAPPKAASAGTNKNWTPASHMTTTTNQVRYVLPAMLSEQAATQRAILAAIQGLDTEAVIAAVNARSAEDAKRDADLSGQLEDVAALVAQVGSGQLAAEEVVGLIGERLRTE